MVMCNVHLLTCKSMHMIVCNTSQPAHRVGNKPACYSHKSTADFLCESNTNPNFASFEVIRLNYLVLNLCLPEAYPQDVFSNKCQFIVLSTKLYKIGMHEDKSSFHETNMQVHNAAI